jgi:hypothetical protein
VTSTTSTSASSSSTTSTTIPATTTTTTKLPGSTTTTLPLITEICGNCIDDDGNGLVDLDDPACCADETAEPLLVRSLRVRERGAETQVKLLANFEGQGLKPLAPSTRALLLRVGPDDGERLVCATIDADQFRASRRTLRVQDRRRFITGAEGLRRLRLRLNRSETAKVKAAGRFPFATPGAGDYRVTVALRDATTDDGPSRCLRAVVRLEPKRHGLGLP